MTEYFSEKKVFPLISFFCNTVSNSNSSNEIRDKNKPNSNILQKEKK